MRSFAPLLLILGAACGTSRDPSANGVRDGGAGTTPTRDGGPRDAGSNDAGLRDGGTPDAGGCGDLVCEAGENAENCDSDCGYVPANDSMCSDLLVNVTGAFEMDSSILDTSLVYTDPFGVEKRAERYGLELDADEGREIRIRFDPAQTASVETRALGTRCELYLLTKIFEEERDGLLAQTYTIVNEADVPATITFQVEHRATATRPLDYSIEIQPLRCSHPSLTKLEGTVSDQIEASDPERLFRGNRFDVYAFDVTGPARTLTLDATTDGLFFNVLLGGADGITTLDDTRTSTELTEPGRYCVQVNESSPEAEQGTARPYQLTLTP